MLDKFSTIARQLADGILSLLWRVALSCLLNRWLEFEEFKMACEMMGLRLSDEEVVRLPLRWGFGCLLLAAACAVRVCTAVACADAREVA